MAETEEEARGRLARQVEADLANFLGERHLLTRFEVLWSAQWDPVEPEKTEYERLVPHLLGWKSFAAKVVDEVLEGKGKRKVFRRWANNLKNGRK
jgi:regulator of sirC expression with transglutaminase-like and TPR domain